MLTVPVVQCAALPPPPGLLPPPPGLPADEPGRAPAPFVEKPIDLFMAIFEADDSSDEEKDIPEPKLVAAETASQPEGSEPALPPTGWYTSWLAMSRLSTWQCKVCRFGDPEWSMYRSLSIGARQSTVCKIGHPV
jgi:hypothetical protein